MSDAPDAASATGSWAQLRRRKVVQWGLAYSAGAWGLLQGIAYLCDTFGWPHRIQALATVALLSGLPIAVTLAWYHGDMGRQRATRAEAALLALLVAGGALLVWRYDRWAAPDATSDATPAVATASVRAPAADARPSVAVLPFENRSASADDAFFVDGIHDDILTQLSKVGSLKVISRTSVERFRGSTLPVRDIARELGVAAVLEGGVQRVGDRVRINVQLIDAASDEHLWAERYDRNLTASDVFAIQSEVAGAIAAALKATLTPRERSLVAASPTRSLAAWESYQIGRQRLMLRNSAAIGEARRYFQKAIDADPEFALAYAGLADAVWLEADYTGQPMDAAIALAEQHLGTALRLDPNLAEARATLAKFAQARREFDKAETLYREAIQLNPNYSPAYHWYAQLLSIQGRDDEALASLGKAVELDPLSPSLRTSLGWGLSGFGDFEGALRELDKAREIDPGSAVAYEAIGSIHARAYGRLDRAIPFLEQAHRLDPGRNALTDHLAQLYLDIGDPRKATGLLASSPPRGGAGLLAIAYERLYAGDRVAALTLAGQAVASDPRSREAWRLLRDEDLAARDAPRARDRYARAYPELLRDGPPQLDWSNMGIALDLAVVLQATGEKERATELLDAYDAFVHKTRTPRMGPWGYGIADAQVLAMRGNLDAALAALQQAEAAGWRGPYWRYYRDFDPTLEPIRRDARFTAAFASIERDVARQRAELSTVRTPPAEPAPGRP